MPVHKKCLSLADQQQCPKKTPVTITPNNIPPKQNSGVESRPTETSETETSNQERRLIKRVITKADTQR